MAFNQKSLAFLRYENLINWISAYYPAPTSLVTPDEYQRNHESWMWFFEHCKDMNVARYSVNDQLLPCKKCGDNNGYTVHYENGVRIVCPKCGYCTREKDHIKNAIDAWNMRSERKTDNANK